MHITFFIFFHLYLLYKNVGGIRREGQRNDSDFQTGSYVTNETVAKTFKPSFLTSARASLSIRLLLPDASGNCLQIYMVDRKLFVDIVARSDIQKLFTKPSILSPNRYTLEIPSVTL